MDSNNLISKDGVYSIVGCAIDVLNSIGHGFHQEPYKNVMVVEFKKKEISYKQKKRFDLAHKNEVASEFTPDLIAHGQVIINTKVIDGITSFEQGEMANFLKITNLQLGLIINFKRPKPEWERIVHSRRNLSNFTSISG